VIPFPSALLTVAAAGGGGSWSPSNLAPDVTTWFDAAFGISYQVAPSVDTWASKVGSALLVRPTTAYPQFVSSSINGLPAVRNFSSSASFGVAYTETGPDLTLAYVGSIANAGSAFGRYVSMSNTGQAADNTNDNSFMVFRSGTGGTTSTISATRNGGMGSLNVGYETYFILVITFDGANGVLWINGTQIGTVAKTSNFNINRLSLWRDAATPAGYSYGAGNFAELLTMNRALTTTERQKLEGYFAWSFALTSALPAGHPYKSAAPTV
jgi:hypothetical protein